MNQVSKAIKAILNAYMQASTNTFYGLEDDFIILIPDSHKEKKLYFETISFKEAKTKSQIKNFTKNKPTINKTRDEIFKQF